MSEDDNSFDVDLTIAFEKGSINDDLRLVGGIGYYAKKGGVVLTDTQGDQIDAANLREAIHDFMKNSRTMGVMHIQVDGKVVKAGEIVEAAVLGDGFNPPGWPADDVALWLVAKVHDDEIWKGVKAGHFTGFSMGGRGVREPIND